jgi:citrate lyase subunit beta/citryl-CoA lyase
LIRNRLSTDSPYLPLFVPATRPDRFERAATSGAQAAIAAARSELVLAAALAGRPAPIDGVTVETSDRRRILMDSRHSVCMGMGGKLLIHPRQIEPARQAYRPTDEDIARAKKVVQTTYVGATVIDGRMVDAPVIAWARRILAMHEATCTGD